MNSRIEEDGIQIGVPEPHPCGLRTSNISPYDLENDYLDLINCCQRHVCRLYGYYKSKKSGPSNSFGYPFKLEPVSKIELIENENSVRANILTMRNDPYINVHNRLICH